MRKLLLLIILFLSGLTAGAAVFVVTSNADSGPGTLRQALLDATANGNTERDYINFNLADLSEAGRTVILQTQLPDLSSNLIMDGSTQNGTKFGLSDTKVELLYDGPTVAKLSVFRMVNLTDVTVLGLYVKNNINLTGLSTATGWLAFDITSCNNTQIGDAGKGNVVSGFYYNLQTKYIAIGPGCVNFILKDNFFGVDADGITIPSNAPNGVSLFNVFGQIIIGGTASEGNLFSNQIGIGGTNYDNEHPSSAVIQNNKFGVDFYSHVSPYSYGLAISTVDPRGNCSYDIEDNVFASSKSGVALSITNIGQKITILRNYIGIDKTLTIPLKTNYGIIVNGCTGDIQVGSNNTTDANYISNCMPLNFTNDKKVTFNKNSIFCVTGLYPVYYSSFGISPAVSVSITQISSTLITGTATPNATVELFYSDHCGTCSPETYFASTTASADGKWQYTGLISGPVIASATINGSTSEFTRITIDVSQVAISNACNSTSGAIKGAIPLSATNVQWLNESGAIVGASADLINVPAGKYHLVVSNGNCSATSPVYEIKDISVSANVSNPSIRNASCNLPNGSINGIFFGSIDHFTTKWRNEAGNVVATTVQLDFVKAGKYTLEVTSSSGICSQTYGPFVISNTIGPNITQTNAIVTSTNCGQSVGSITNITATGTGTLKYSWKNAQNQQVATTKDLLNQPAGIYTLQVTDDTNCGPVYTSAITIPEVNGITMDETAATQTPITCAGSLATVSGIKVTGATTYQWFNNQGLVVGNAADLSTGSPGNYRLVVSNANGCNQTSKVYTIIQQTNTDIYGGLSKVLKDATCDLNNGSIQVLFTDNPAVLPKSYRWVNHSSGITVATTTTPILTGIDAGAYDIYATNSTGCERMLITYSIGRIPGLTVLGITAQVTDDQCGTATGSIKGVGAGGKTPLSFVWTDNKGAVVGTAIDLLKVKAGNYHLKVSDGSGCEQTLVYTIRNQNNILPAPVVSNLQLCGSGDAILSVSNTSASLSYRLYDAYTSEMPMDEQVSGRFKINVKQGRSYYVSQFVGECESERIEVKVTVGISTINIANTFSPNGDGINDSWNIANIQNYPNGNVQIFTRSGQKVFESIGYSIPFDGRYNGKNLPMGTYYYIINLNSGCGLLSGNLTLIR